MYNLDVYKGDPNRTTAKIKQLGVKRDWMSIATYHCYPLTVANTIGYGIYFEDDIKFSWDGNLRNPAIATEGKEHVWSGRPEGTVSFETNLIFNSDENTSLLTIPVPNQIIKGVTTISTLVSTSFFTGSFPVVWKLEEPGEYFVPAGTNLACIVPISMKSLNNSNINFKDIVYPGYRLHNDTEYIDAIHKHAEEKGNQPKLYKKGIDHHGNVVGSHEVDNLVLKVTY